MAYDTGGTARILGMTVAAFASVAAGVILLGALIIGGWQAGWWFTAQNVNRTDKVTQQGYANQSALSAQVTAEFSDIAREQADEQQTPANKTFDQPQIITQAGQICQQLPQFAPGYTIDPQWRSWEHANCADSALSATSALRK